jgi:hypothetical protein
MPTGSPTPAALTSKKYSLIGAVTRKYALSMEKFACLEKMSKWSEDRGQSVRDLTKEMTLVLCWRRDIGILPIFETCKHGLDEPWREGVADSPQRMSIGLILAGSDRLAALLACGNFLSMR